MQAINTYASALGQLGFMEDEAEEIEDRLRQGLLGNASEAAEAWGEVRMAWALKFGELLENEGRDDNGDERAAEVTTAKSRLRSAFACLRPLYNGSEHCLELGGERVDAAKAEARKAKAACDDAEAAAEEAVEARHEAANEEMMMQLEGKLAVAVRANETASRESAAAAAAAAAAASEHRSLMEALEKVPLTPEGSLAGEYVRCSLSQRKLLAGMLTRSRDKAEGQRSKAAARAAQAARAAERAREAVDDLQAMKLRPTPEVAAAIFGAIVHSTANREGRAQQPQARAAPPFANLSLSLSLPLPSPRLLLLSLSLSPSLALAGGSQRDPTLDRHQRRDAGRL